MRLQLFLRMKLQLIFILILSFFYLQEASIAGRDEDLKADQSLARISGVCAYHAEAAKIISTHKIVILDTGFDTWHQDLKNVFYQAYNPREITTEVNQVVYGNATDNLHGTAVAGIIHHLTPTTRLIPIVFTKNPAAEALKALDHALNKADGNIINISLSLSEKGLNAAGMAQNVKDLFIKAFSQEKIIITSAGNVALPMNQLPITRDRKTLSELSNGKFIIVGATTPHAQGEERLWRDGATLPSGDADSYYIPTYTMGSTYPGSDETYQRIFVTAPANHYTAEGWWGDYYFESNLRKNFGMTSSAAPVVTALVERLWTHSPHANAAAIGHAIYNGANKNFSWYEPELYGMGMVNYENSLKLLQKK